MKVLKNAWCRDLPGGPVVKISASNVGAAGSIPGWGAKIHMPLGQKTKLKTEAIL